MALYYDLPVFKDVYQLILKMFDYTNHFPPEYKFTLGQDISYVTRQKPIENRNGGIGGLSYFATFIEVRLSDIRLLTNLNI